MNFRVIFFHLKKDMTSNVVQMLVPGNGKHARVFCAYTLK